MATRIPMRLERRQQRASGRSSRRRLGARLAARRHRRTDLAPGMTWLQPDPSANGKGRRRPAGPGRWAAEVGAIHVEVGRSGEVKQQHAGRGKVPGDGAPTSGGGRRRCCREQGRGDAARGGSGMRCGVREMGKDRASLTLVARGGERGDRDERLLAARVKEMVGRLGLAGLLVA
ncbi:hypothetical protein CFC21_097574 [Triticum aestivum]|uniref:Uncharacterized protein n=3 Tax=Triticum TaxID=4564 RepID=A0A9R1BN93_TRITD|nr:hypothetical protein CFC21_097574 [Triticum aestivum]VAI74240.1 unnamed protein product [Triticum turgidum subsp. durum]